MLLQNTPHHIAVWAAAGTRVRPKHYVFRICVCVVVHLRLITISRTLGPITVWVHRQCLTFSFWRLPKIFDHFLPCQLLE